VIQIAGSKIELNREEEKQKSAEGSIKEVTPEERKQRDLTLNHWVCFYAIYSFLVFVLLRVSFLSKIPWLDIGMALFVTWLWYPEIRGGSYIVSIFRRKYFKGVDEKYIQINSSLVNFFKKLGIFEMEMSYLEVSG